jgi:hypothetical protein
MGAFTGASTCSGCNSNPTMYMYNESLSGTSATGYVAFPSASNTETLATGRGYSIYVRANIDPVLSAGSARWDVRAPINSGTINFPATFTSTGTSGDGWNLVGNPYPSTIDWDAASGWTRTGITNAIYMRDNGQEVNASYVNGVGVNGGSRYIAMGQAFFVYSGGGPVVFQATEAVKVAGTQTSYLREIPQEIVRVTLRKGLLRDEMIVRFKDVATDEFDGQWDAFKLANAKLNLSSIIATGKQLSINSLPGVNCGKVVKLAVENVDAGAYQLDFAEFENISDNVKIHLFDSYTGSSVNVRTNRIYPFEVTADTSTYGLRRFELRFLTEEVADFTVQAADACAGNDVSFSVENSSASNRYRVMKNGSALSDWFQGTGGQLALTVAASQIGNGEHTVTIQASLNSCASTVADKAVVVNVEAIPAVTATSVERCGAGVVTLQASGAETGNYRWYESETQPAIEGANSEVYVTEDLVKSKTYYVSAVNALGCEGPRQPVQAIVRQFELVTITAEGNILTSSYSTGNQWYLDGEAIADATSQTIEVKESGVYEVEVFVNGCSARAGREMLITGTEFDINQGIRFYPNPVADKLTIEVPDTGKAVSGEIVSSVGQPVGTTRFVSDGQYLKGYFDLRDLSPGLYVLKITQDKKTVNYKVIKQ